MKTLEELIKSINKYFGIDLSDLIYNLDSNLNIDSYTSLKNPLVKQIITKANRNNIEEVIKGETHSSSYVDVRNLSKELKQAIILGQRNSVFYLTQTIAERFVDILIKDNYKKLSKYTFKYKDEDGEKTKKTIGDQIAERFTLNHKIKLLEHLKEDENTRKDYDIFLEYIRLLQRCRNKHMYHRFHVEDYRKYMGEEQEMFENIQDRMEAIKKETIKVLTIEEGKKKKKVPKRNRNNM